MTTIAVIITRRSFVASNDILAFVTCKLSACISELQNANHERYDVKMGNIVKGGVKVDSAKPDHTILTVRAAAAFKANVSRAKRKSPAEQIDEIIEWKFRRKNAMFRLQPGSLAEVSEVQLQEQTDSDDPGKEFFKFVRSINVGDGKHSKLAFNDTSVAWTALRESANREKRASMAIDQRRESGWFKKLGDAVRFLRRSSVDFDVVKTFDEVLSYNEMYIPRWDKHCQICRMSSTEDSPLNPCRICPRKYHTECMESRGYLSQRLTRETVKLSLEEIGWSCFNCENLFDLLSDTQKIDTMETFDKMDTDQDSVINREEYMKYQKDRYRKLLGMEMPGYRVSFEEETFADMDRDGTGVIDWWEFLIPMCVRKLKERKKRYLVSFLTKREVYKLRKFFKAYDQDGNGEISKNLSRLAFKNWYLSLINLREEQVPVWDWLGTEWVIRDPEPEGLLRFQRSTMVTWKDFVKNHALYILAARPNTGSMRPYVPRMASYGTEFDDEDD